MKTLLSLLAATAMIAFAAVLGSSPLQAEADISTQQICSCPICAPGTPPEQCQCTCSTPAPTPEPTPLVCLPGYLYACPICAPGTPPEQCQCTCVAPSPEPVSPAENTNSNDTGGNGGGGGSESSSNSSTPSPTPKPVATQLPASKVTTLFTQVFQKAPTSTELLYWRTRTDKPSDAALRGAMRWHAQSGKTTPNQGKVAGATSFLPRLNELFRSTNQGVNPTIEQWSYWANRMHDVSSEDGLLEKMRWHNQQRTPWSAR